MSRVVYFLISFAIIVQAAPKYKLCVYPQKEGLCNTLSVGNSQVQCVKVQDSVDCALKIQKGVIDFGVFTSEQVHLVSRFVSGDTAIVGEIRLHEKETDINSYQTVVVVRNNEVQSIKDLYKKKYCHPGFDYDNLWTLRVRKELEKSILDKGYCSNANNLTFAENEIAQLSNYFEAACRPGPWVPDTEVDAKLKKQYSNLCSLCDDTQKCSYNSNRANANAVKCLKEKGGTVAYTSLQAALEIPDKNNYKLLCKNGQLADINRNVSAACAWRNQPWPLIISRLGKEREIQNDLKSWIDASRFAVTQGASPFSVTNDVWMPVLTEVLATAQTDRFNIFSNSIQLDTYLSQNGQLLDTSSNDNCKMRWCVLSSDENTKCEWVSTAASVIGIKPEISCVQGRHVYDCLDKIEKKEADVISIDSNYGYIARKKHIHNLLYNQKHPDDVSSIYILLSQSSSVASFSDLKNKKVCFPEYRGLAWVSFIESARRHRIIKRNCDFGNNIAGLFSEICAPGAEDAFHHNSTQINPEKLCSICKDKNSDTNNCNANDNNRYYDTQGALQCLIDNVADVAIVEKRDLDAQTDLNLYNVLCENGKVIRFSDAADGCALSTTVNSEIIARMDDPQNVDFRLALLQINENFALYPHKIDLMELFKKFDDKEDLMFKSSVIAFDDGLSENDYVKNYIELFKHVDQCTDGASSNQVSLFLLIISVIIAFNFIHAD